VIKEWLGRIKSHVAPVAQAVPGTTEEEVEALRIKIWQQRIMIQGLSKKLGVFRERVWNLQGAHPAIHKEFFPAPTFNTRRQK